VEQLKAFFARIPVQTRKIAVEAVAEYLIGDDTHGLKHYVGYKYVSRKRAYGQTFSSDKQRRYVMAMIREGKITPGRANRSGGLKAGWQYKKQGAGYGATIYNTKDYAKWVQGDETQARQPGMVGWRKMSVIISTNIKGAMKRANERIAAWLRSNNK
jgi:hypothetical protein